MDVTDNDMSVSLIEEDLTDIIDQCREIGWEWINIHDFIIYLVENEYICQYSVADIPICSPAAL